MTYIQALAQLTAIYHALPDMQEIEEDVGHLAQLTNAALAIATKCNARIDWVAGNGNVTAL